MTVSSINSGQLAHINASGQQPITKAEGSSACINPAALASRHDHIQIVPLNEAKQIGDLDNKNCSISLTDIFRPKILFDKLLSRILYPYLIAHHPFLEQDYNILKNKIPDLEEKLIKTADGHYTRVWFAANPNANARTKVYLHGNASNIANFKDEAFADYNKGCNVCLMSYRGYSSTPGKPSREGLIADTNAVLDFLIREKNLPADNMDFIAHSLGSAVLLNTLASRTEQFGKLLLLAPFASIRDMISSKIKILPQFLIKWLTNVWNNEEALSKLKGRIAGVEIAHGSKDEVIPCQQSEKLHQCALGLGIKSSRVELVGRGHNDNLQD